MSPALAGRFFTTSAAWEAPCIGVVPGISRMISEDCSKKKKKLKTQPLASALPLSSYVTLHPFHLELIQKIIYIYYTLNKYIICVYISAELTCITKYMKALIINSLGGVSPSRNLFRCMLSLWR